MIPAWVKVSNNACLVSIAEETYTARSLAVDTYSAEQFSSCAELLAAGEKDSRS